jgi:nucleotide-binding universal stress UspA family protein
VLLTKVGDGGHAFAPTRLEIQMATKSAQARSKRYAIVVGFDFSPPSEAALREAIDLAGRRRGAEVHVVYALDAERGAAGGHGMKKLDARIEKATAKLRAYTTKLRAQLKDQANPSVLTMNVRVRDAAHAIVQMAVDLDADLVVVGAHSDAWLKGLLMGSTASKVTKNARCPVIVVRPKSYAGLTRSPSLEPQCPACVAKRVATTGATWWCSRHADPIALPHTYSYSLAHPFGSRDVDIKGPRP